MSTTPDTLPPLPEPEGTYWTQDQNGHSVLEHSDTFTAEQMREYAEAAVRAALAAQPAGEPVAWRYRVPAAGGGSAWTFTQPQPELLLETQPLYAGATAAVQAAPDADLAQYNEWLVARMRRVAKAAGYKMPNMTTANLAGAAPTILGGIALELELRAKAAAAPAQAQAQEAQR